MSGRITPAPLLPTALRVGRLETVDQWRREIGRLYRSMKRGDISAQDGTRLAYVADIGAKLAKFEQELRELTHLREQLAQLEARGVADLPRLESPADASVVPQ